MLIRSLYRDSDKEQFEMEIMGENETEYKVRLLPEYQDKFQERDNITTLRKCLIGSLYELKADERQLTIFDF